MQTLRAFLRLHPVSMTVDWADENPNMADMPQGSSHWRCVLRHDRRQLTTYFSMGPAHSHQPTVREVLDCLASDASCVENARDFEEFARELGYDTDSRKAERIYNVCRKQSARLARLLGRDTYHSLLWNTERE